MTEALILAAGGGTLGVLLAPFAVDALVRVSPIHLPVTHGINIDTVVLAFTTAVCVLRSGEDHLRVWENVLCRETGRGADSRV